MTRQEFNTALQEAGISKKDFSYQCGLRYRSVNGWGTNEKAIPAWVKSWLTNYKDAQRFKAIEPIVEELCIKMAQQ
ncbi:MAG: XRE family transcriptional regulator [Epsilonproteobacteria bacterium]|nr:XRE family transcriptional regulator [Campylobacterota bacterium]